MCPNGTALLLQRVHHGPTARDGLQAAGITAPARDPLRRSNLVVAELPRGLGRTALQDTTGDDPRAQPGRDLQHQDVVLMPAFPSAIALASLSMATGTPESRFSSAK